MERSFPESKVQAYLMHLQAQERQNRRKRWLVSSIMILATGLLSMHLLHSPIPRQDFAQRSLEWLTPQRAHALLEKSTILLVSHPYGVDTLASPDAFNYLVDCLPEADTVLPLLANAEVVAPPTVRVSRPARNTQSRKRKQRTRQTPPDSPATSKTPIAELPQQQAPAPTEIDRSVQATLAEQGALRSAEPQPVKTEPAALPPAIKDVNPFETNPLVPLSRADRMPEFPGGIGAMRSYLRTKLRYPQAARQQQIKGTVFVRVVVQSSGRLVSPRVIKGIGGGCDQEALRLVHSMPAWKPGMHQGQEVAVFKTIPITF